MKKHELELINEIEARIESMRSRIAIARGTFILMTCGFFIGAFETGNVFLWIVMGLMCIASVVCYDDANFKTDMQIPLLDAEVFRLKQENARLRGAK